ncbi:uncharacterized mitochondrial protein AtMg00820-like [Carya illinoinensis]|uniref:uncharacterized mitochondrial protein AtMg00820-like n=1 Tax=Carya illinoinensis TaxID=32201 RepID=UPI001C726790|nr:uncharacterized mitochondrial protein AtMg00820-like [Carya illinoinensis]
MHKPNPCYANLHNLVSIPTEPKSIKSARSQFGWSVAMEEELATLAANKTWELVPRTIDMNVIGSKWVYEAKLKVDGTLERLKGRLVVKGFSQLDGLDFSETFSPVVKPTTIRVDLTLATIKNWGTAQLGLRIISSITLDLYGFSDAD